MTEQEILARLRDIIVQIKDDTSPVGADAVQLASVLGEPPLSMDSLDVVRMIVEIEESFDILADEADFLHMRTVGDCVTAIGRKLTSLEPA